MQFQVTSGGSSGQGWWQRRILIAQGDGVRDSASRAARPWSGCGKHHEGKLSVRIQPLSAEARGREASWEDGFMSGEQAESGQGWPVVPESRPYLQPFLQLWCICLALLWSLQTFLKAWDAPLPFPEDSPHVQGPKAEVVRMAAESGRPASRSTS